MPDIIRPQDLADLDQTAQTRSDIADDGRELDDDPHFEADLASAERRLRYAREHPIFGVHPEGVGPTLGQDLGRPNPGHDVEWNDEDYDPPT